MPPRYFVALNDAENDAKQFDEPSINDPEKIREKFREKMCPTVLYEDGDREKGRIVGQDSLSRGVVYVWYIKKEPWEVPEVVQNALFCCQAVYKKNPYQFLKGGLFKTFHTVNHVIAVGDYKSEGKSLQRCMLVLSQSPETKETTLIVAFKGSTTKEDWHTNLTVSHIDDIRHAGKFHSGFHKRASCISIDDILYTAEYYEATKILTCGHSLGGAVSTIVHMNLLHQGSQQVGKANIINITFGAPFVGNERVEKYANEKELSRNMFHFAAVTDIVPGILSLGHAFRVVREEAGRKASDRTGGVSEVLIKRQFVDARKNALTLCKMAVEAFFDRDEERRDLFASIDQVITSFESTLQNEYMESNYVPVGKTVILAQGQNAEMMDQGPKIKERILQSALEDQVRQMSPEQIIAGHSMENYQDLVKGTSFTTFSRDDQRVKVNKIPVEHKFNTDEFEFLTLCDFRCAFAGCEEAHRDPLYEHDFDKVVMCYTCQKNPNKEEYFFHYQERCTQKCKSDKHWTVEIRNGGPQMYTTSYRKGAFLDNPESTIVRDAMDIAAVSTSLVGTLALGKELAQFIAKNNAASATAAEFAESALGSMLPQIASETNLMVALASFTIKTGNSFRLWWTGKMSGRDFIVQSVGHASEALGGLGGTFVGAKVGAPLGAYGGPIGLIVGAAVGGFVGGVAGAIGGRKIVDWLDQWWTAKEEEGGRANAIVEAMVLLDTPNIDLLKTVDVYSCYRRKALLQHPDKLPQGASEEKRKQANANFVMLTMARDCLVEALDHPQHLTKSLKKRIEDQFRKVSKDIGVLNLLKGMKERQEKGAARAVEN